MICPKKLKAETQTTEQIKNFWSQLEQNFEVRHETDT